MHISSVDVLLEIERILNRSRNSLQSHPLMLSVQAVVRATN